MIGNPITLRIHKLLTLKPEDVQICRHIESLFMKPPKVFFDWDGHTFTGYLKVEHFKSELYVGNHKIIIESVTKHDEVTGYNKIRYDDDTGVTNMNENLNGSEQIMAK